MIIDLNTFIKEERAYWTELEVTLERLERDSGFSFDLSGVKRFHYLYQRASADLARLVNFSAEQDLRVYLETLVGRAFADIHESRRRSGAFKPFTWFFRTFPQTFRKQIMAFYIAVAVMMSGCLFGAGALLFDSDSKEILMPFPHLLISPEQRVAKEESVTGDTLKGKKTSFSAYLMTHNTRVSIFAMALGMTWGIGTIVILFSNGVMLGAIVADYMVSGQTRFLLGWLLPHGSIEIPAILLASQAGLVLAFALIGCGKPVPLRRRLRKITGDLVTLIGGASVLLVWAGFVEAFLSQYHEPLVSYTLKISFGTVELILLIFFLSKSGHQKKGSGMQA